MPCLSTRYCLYKRIITVLVLFFMFYWWLVPVGIGPVNLAQAGQRAGQTAGPAK